MGELGIILLYMLGMALVVAEIFIPGAVMGLIGLVFILAGIFLAFRGDFMLLGWILAGVTILSAPLLVLLWVKVLNKVLSIKGTQKGYTSAMVELKELVGQEGVAVTQLRPSGMARFGDRKVDVVAEGEVIARNTRVRIIEVESNRVVVRAVRG